MHRLIIRSIEGFLRETYGGDLWKQTAAASGIDADGFQFMSKHPDTVVWKIARNAAARLNKPDIEVIEDLGAWLARFEPVRRLLRFSGTDYREFITGLDEFLGLAQLAIPELKLPRLNVIVRNDSIYEVVIDMPQPFWRPLAVGVLRAMADDYGALVVIDWSDADPEAIKPIRVELLAASFAEGRRFDLSQGAISG